MDRMNVGDPKIDGGASLRLLSCWHDAHEQAHSAAVEKRHLRWRGEEKRDPQRVTVIGNARLEIIDRDEQLGDLGVGKVHLDDRWRSFRQKRRRFAGGAWASAATKATLLPCVGELDGGEVDVRLVVAVD